MADRRAVAAGVLLALAAAGCSSDDAVRPDTGGDDGAATSTGPGGDVAYELVATDELSVSPGGSQVLADCWNGICRWDAVTGRLELVPDRGSVAVSPDWSSLVRLDGSTVVLEDTATGEAQRELTGLPEDGGSTGSAATAVAFSPDGSRLAAAYLADDGAGVVVWSVADGEETARFEAGSEVLALAFAPDADRVLTVGNGPAEVHDLTGGRAAEVPGTGPGASAAWSPDARQLVVPAADGSPAVVDADDLTPVADLPGARLHEAAFAPGSGTVAITSLDSTTVTLWDPATQETVRLEGHTDPPGAVAWSPDGRTLYSVSADDGLRAWSVRRGAPRPVTYELPPDRGE